MKKQISFAQYRTIDLVIMALLLAVSQALICVAANVWYRWEMYIVSPVAVITAIVMMRWGIWGGIHALLGGVVYTCASGGALEHYVIYGLGNLLGLGGLVFLKLFGKERVWRSGFLSVCFALTVQLLMLVGRGLVALAFGHSIYDALGFITTDLLSLLFTGVVVWVARRVDGLFEDQKHYLLRIQEENK